MPLHFFFYGTLIAGSDNPAARAVHGRLRRIGAACVPGALWAVPDAAGWYPALLEHDAKKRDPAFRQKSCDNRVFSALCDSSSSHDALSEPRARVHGIVYAAADGFGPEDLTRLDEWEDFDPEQPAQSLYLRTAIQITQIGGASYPAQVYRYNQPLPADAREIPGGDFPGWLEANRLIAYTR